jgi:hypothetical protein
VENVVLKEKKAIIRRGSFDNPSSILDYNQVLSELFKKNNGQFDECCGAPNRIYLKYAIRSYLIQTAKVLRLLQEIVGFNSKYRLEINNLFSTILANDNSVKTILRLDREIWSIMEEIWSSKK